MIFSKKIKSLHYFDYAIFLAFLLIGIGFLIFFFRKSYFLTVKIKVTEKNILYLSSSPPSWFVYLFKPGMKEIDGLGRTTAELTDIYYYDTSPEKKAVYLTLKLRTTYNNRSKEYKYNGSTIGVGESLKVNLEKLTVEGLITDVEGLTDVLQYETIIIKGQIQEFSPVFLETTGVDSFVARAISIGDKVVDSKGQVVVEVIDKDVHPAQKNTFDTQGNVYLRNDPRREDVILTLKVRAKKIRNEYYFFDDIRLKVWNAIPVHLPNISVWPIITEIVSASEKK